MKKKIEKAIVSMKEIDPYLNRFYNLPELNESFTENSFEEEFNRAHDILIEELEKIGSVKEHMGPSNFMLSRHVDLNRAITVVLDMPYKRKTFKSILRGLERMKEELGVEYVVCLDAEGAYTANFIDGRVWGHYHTNELFGKLALLWLGFSPFKLMKAQPVAVDNSAR